MLTEYKRSFAICDKACEGNIRTQLGNNWVLYFKTAVNAPDLSEDEIIKMNIKVMGKTLETCTKRNVLRVNNR